MDIMIEVHKVKLGMFVAQLDRPWLGTPFHFQGFWVNDLNAINNLRQFCRAVWVRTDKRGRPTDVKDAATVDWRDRTVRSDRDAQAFDYLPMRPVNHLDSAVVEDELDAARTARA